MRTFKKSLSLVLALVFVLGLCTVGANAGYATRYSDIAEVTYVDAVEVLTGLGVVEGYKDGSFQPGGDVTRAEAAAMIARMMLGREAADKLPVGDVKFSDVGEDHWAAQYIAFCANKKIIKGDSGLGGKFRPNDNVKGTELATMLLRALGYGAIAEYDGQGWDINAVADALYYGIFKNSKVTDFNKKATREETALYIWNTMWIQLVGYDVDLNYYNGKEERVADGWGDWGWVPITFAGMSFNLEELGYNSKTFEEKWVVLANQETGADYTVIGFLDADGDWVTLNLDYATGLEYIGHEVTAYIDAERHNDKKTHEDYYDTYLVLDESTTIAPFTDFSNYDGLYRALKAANKRNVNVDFADVLVWNNYDYEDDYYLRALLDWDDFGWFRSVEDLKGQKSSSDALAWLTAMGTAYGTWVLDHAGEILVVLRTNYKVGQVIDVDTDHDEVEVSVYDRGIDDSEAEIFDMVKGDKTLVYDGIAKDDFVVVQPVGSLTYLKPTDTLEMDITSRSASVNLLDFGPTWTFNGMGADTYGDGITIEDQDDPAEVGVGDKVKFYIIKGAFSNTYFGLEILERAKSEGIVYVNYKAEAIDHSGWDTDPTTPTYVYNVQCINQDGEEVIYKMRHRYEDDGVTVLAEDKAAYDALATGDVYEVRVRGKYASFDDDPKNAGGFTKLVGKNSYLKSDDDIYYVTKDTKVIYFKGEGKTLEIEDVANSLADNEAKTEFNVYGIYKKSGGNYKLSVLWVPGEKAPEDYGDSFLYLNGSTKISGKNYTKPAGYELFNDDEDPYYTAYIDGVKTSVHIDSDYNVFKGENVLSGFYKFNVDEDGVYWLKKVEEKVYDSNVGGLVRLKNGSILKDDDGKYRIYTDGSDGSALKVEFVDLSSGATGTTKDTKTDAAVIDAARLAQLLRDGYEVDVAYMYSVNAATGNQTPTGVLYIVAVYDEDDLAV